MIQPEYSNTIPLTLVAASINLPTQSRFHTQLQYANDRCTFYLSALITRNLFEPAFTQLNIPLPEKNSAAPGKRNVYPALPGARLILDNNGKNPLRLCHFIAYPATIGGWRIFLESEWFFQIEYYMEFRSFLRKQQHPILSGCHRQCIEQRLAANRNGKWQK